MTRATRDPRIIAAVTAAGIILAGAVVALVSPAVHPEGHRTSARATTEAKSSLGALRPKGAPAPAPGAPPTGVAAIGATGAGPGAGGDQTSAAPSAAPPGQLPSELTGPKVVRTADLAIEVTKGGFQSAFDQATTIVQRDGGFVVSSSIGSPGPVQLPVPEPQPAQGIDPLSPSTAPPPAHTARPVAGELQLRVPGDRFNETRLALERLGTRIVGEQLAGNDVGGQLVDLDARVTTLKAEQNSLRAIAAKAATTQDLLQIEGQLTQVETQIEQLKGEQARLSNSVTLAAIRIEITEPGAAAGTPPEPHRSQLARSWSRAGAAVLAVTGGVLIVVGYLAPLVVLGGLSWLGFWLVGRRRRSGATALVP